MRIGLHDAEHDESDRVRSEDALRDVMFGRAEGPDAISLTDVETLARAIAMIEDEHRRLSEELKFLRAMTRVRIGRLSKEYGPAFQRFLQQASPAGKVRTNWPTPSGTLGTRQRIARIAITNRGKAIYWARRHYPHVVINTVDPWALSDALRPQFTWDERGHATLPELPIGLLWRTYPNRLLGCTRPREEQLHGGAMQIAETWDWLLDEEIEGEIEVPDGS